MSLQTLLTDWILKTQKTIFWRMFQLFCPYNESKVFKTTLKPTDFHCMDKKLTIFFFIQTQKKVISLKLHEGNKLCQNFASYCWLSKATDHRQWSVQFRFHIYTASKASLTVAQHPLGINSSTTQTSSHTHYSTIWMSSKASWETTMSLMWCLPIAGALIHSSLAKTRKVFPKTYTFT